MNRKRINIDLSIWDVGAELQEHHLIFYFTVAGMDQAVAFAKSDVIKLRDAINEWLNRK